MKRATVRRHALSLPATTEAPHFNFSSFRVDGRIFATMPPGDELLHVFVDDTDRAAAIALHPDFVEPLPWGKKIVGVRVTLAKADAASVKHLLDRAWANKAKKSAG